MEDYKEKYKIGDRVRGKRTFNGETVEGEFHGFHLCNKLNPNSVVCAIITDKGCYDVSVDSLELAESEDERIRKELLYFVQHEKEYVESQVKPENSHKLRFLIDAIAWLEKQGEPTWSEEDEEKLNSIIEVLCEDSLLVDWLKSLKDRVQPQPKQEWSEEDSKRLARIHQFIWANRKGDTDEIYQQEQDADWLMTLKPQPKQEWSKEDKYKLGFLTDMLEGLDSKDFDLNYMKELSNWLKSLKPNHWKPSEKQMKTLSEWLKNHQYDGDSRYVYPIFQSLYSELKKL